jgi:hypothetical protein
MGFPFAQEDGEVDLLTWHVVCRPTRAKKAWINQEWLMRTRGGS